jgi:hypothetical protein
MIRLVTVFTFVLIVAVCSYVVLNLGYYSSLESYPDTTRLT